MSDTKMLQSILDKVSTLDRKVDGGFKEVNQRIDRTEKNLTIRIDKLGLQLANLEDDAPTIEEFDNLEKRVTKLEKQAASV
ncbi:MAG: hypothetical protein US60_C0053G0006 [Microgenomates group bacterium GW2011_GWC1_37_8]|uniref:Uncharacterized protein n=1 Tax=Candidatus Woesebacteria bacterium GW2011_GWB1_38_8 TaxID=1618570 RepID=A0A0G0L127_9BACT|nr:MAG: hypothetical protein US60_C0053G0006 [Microgenomates group bacterium GW2011_GWC1_37_8]KKQ84692.1 MAG: hypothetical protein UT08_C0015G0028 [Candidatus Woesebacteria bacterium GW2011_GWB1_38_8]